MPYKYTDRDLLEDPPYHYIYSAFEGPGFLDAYVASRSEERRRMGASVVQAVPNINIPRFKAEAEFETEVVLGLLVEAVRAGPGRRLDEILPWVDLFARKFEATKRLRRSYGRDLRPLDRSPVARKAYAQLAFLIAALIDSPADLRLLNTLLKLNDLVLSGPALDESIAALVGPSIDRELACVRELAARLQVRSGELLRAE